jgi:hypothetical protein
MLFCLSLTPMRSNANFMSGKKSSFLRGVYYGLDFPSTLVQQ